MILYLLLLIIIILIGAPRVIMVQQAGKKIYSVEDVSPTRAAVVFGAGLTSSGGPTTVLRDRVETAVLLYKAGKVEKVLMSGDNRFINYNEPGAMKAYALELGMPEEDIVLDYAGRRTYDTCYRARDIFLLDDVILVTQNFHLSRALYTCKALGLETVGVSADLRPYREEGYWNIREIPACMMAYIQVHITKPEPVLGDQEPIFSLE
ncbi:MAG: YdcF family protein [Anaerolineales bacterium]|nr:YdcF family protein [Anaerolineales bacterium]